MPPSEPLPRRAPRHRGLLVTGGAATFVTALTAVVVNHRADPSLRVIVIDGALMGASLWAALSCGLTARRSGGRLRRAWGLLALTCALWFAGSAAWTGHEVLTGVVPLPSIADVFYVPGFAAGAAGLVCFPSVRKSRVARISTLVDAVVVGGSVMFAASALVLPRTDRIRCRLAGGGSPADRPGLRRRPGRPRSPRHAAEPGTGSSPRPSPGAVTQWTGPHQRPQQPAGTGATGRGDYPESREERRQCRPAAIGARPVIHAAARGSDHMWPTAARTLVVLASAYFNHSSGAPACTRGGPALRRDQ